MINNLQIINIDGTEGSGKTTQIRNLAGQLRMDGHEVQINYLDDTIGGALECAQLSEKFLQENPDGIVINDGSIARMIVTDLVKGISQPKVVEKYRLILHMHEVLNHKYGVANVLFVMEDLEVCNARMKKQSELTHSSSYKTINPRVERSVIQGIRQFNDNVITQNLKFHVIEIDVEDSILEVRDMVFKYLEDNFIIKKPSVEGSLG